MQEKRKRKVTRRIAISLIVLAVISVLGALTLLSLATVEVSANGVATRLRIPVLPRVGDAAVPIFVATEDKVSIPGFLDGPIVRKGKDGSWSAAWFCEDHAEDTQGTGTVLRIECARKTYSFALQEPPPRPAILPMPEKVVVLSDLEGNIAFLDKVLRKLEIVDASGNWQFGAGNLVILGDSVDRGRDVFAVLWRLYMLAAQADSSGGAVHVMLGNHEQYMLRTNPSKANHEHIYALNMMGGYQQAFAADTVIGRWLREQPVLLKLGSVLFAHGGVSPAVARTGLSIEEINGAMKGYWNAPPAEEHRSAALDAVLAPTGVTQYRGYFRGIEDRYPAASQADVNLALEHFGATQIVVAHTVVEKIENLHDGRVYAIDVNSNESRPEVLMYENGVPRVIDTGIARYIEKREEGALREFSLASAADRKLLVDMYEDISRLVALPHPY